MSIPQPTLSAYESGRNKSTVDVVINIADKCNVSVDWLCGRDEQTLINSLGDIFLNYMKLKNFHIKQKFMIGWIQKMMMKPMIIRGTGFV